MNAIEFEFKGTTPHPHGPIEKTFVIRVANPTEDAWTAISRFMEAKTPIDIYNRGIETLLELSGDIRESFNIIGCIVPISVRRQKASGGWTVLR